MTDPTDVPPPTAVGPRDRVAAAILHALKTRTTPDTELWPGGPKTPGFTLSCHEIADVALTELAAELTQLGQLLAGEAPHEHEYTQTTPAQWIWRWNRATVEQRLQVAGAIQRDSDTARNCIMGDHASLRERNSQLRHALIRGLRLAGELENESAGDANAQEIATRLTEALMLGTDDQPSAPASVPRADGPTCQPEVTT